WSRKNKTLCLSKRARISANRSSSSTALVREILEISAPSAGATSSTLGDDLSVPGGTIAGAETMLADLVLLDIVLTPNFIKPQRLMSRWSCATPNRGAL